ncbi:MAG: helix-hairpin-helix domain-containing protein [Betaproteobacteria bacterium]|nr:helix-hairpin-helix domain-containing protein [Betaproteobacteria bacterium]
MKKLLLILIACFAFATAAFAGPVNLNTATQAELDTLKGVGPVKAKAIVDYRTQNGPFKSVDDLEKVSGFGKKTVDKLRADLTVSGGAAPAKAEGKGKKEAAPAKVEEKAKPATDAKKDAVPAKGDDKAARKDGKASKKEADKKGAAAK